MLKRVKEFKFYVIVAALLLLTTAPRVWGQQFKITSEPGVPDEAKGNAEQAVEATLRFFKETYHLELKKDYRIILVPNKESYVAALMREANVDRKEAERRARTSFGWAIQDVILQNAGGLPNAWQRIYNMSHEVVHKFQSETCTGGCSQIKWIHEGTATVIGQRMLDVLGLRPMGQTKKMFLQNLRKRSTRPTLKNLRSTEEWYKALEQYGMRTFGFVGLAVLNLTDQKGYESLFVYFKKLNGWRAKNAFKIAFRLDLNHYEDEFSTWIEKQLDKP
ncbi:MAG: hypothetical protein AMK69_24005 [Nitrospira bacterium SG8_3]|nr:MAG: hypothetical protein AMK69_24005 [Nitrospira bacterium SG8_3]